jgi:uncharacterized protein YegP (UPF0339 family)
MVEEKSAHAEVVAKKAVAVVEKAPKAPKAPKPPEARKITPRFEVQIGANHVYLWRLINDGKILITSKSFPAKADAFAAIRIVKESVPSKSAIELKGENGKHFFRLKTASHQVLATSEIFEKSEDREAAIIATRRAPQAAVIDKTL